MEAGIVLVMPHNAAGQCGHATIGIVGQRQRFGRSGPDATIEGREPIGHGGAGQKVRLVNERAAVGEVVHARRCADQARC